MVKLGWKLRRKAAPAAAKRLMRRALLCTPPRNTTRRRARKNARDSFSQTDAMSFSLRTNVLVGVRISQPGNTFEAAKARRPLSDSLLWIAGSIKTVNGAVYSIRCAVRLRGIDLIVVSSARLQL